MSTGCCKLTRAASLTDLGSYPNTPLARRSPTRDTDIMVDRATRLEIKMRKTQITSCPNSINHRKIAVYSIYPRVYRKKVSFLLSRHCVMVWSSVGDMIPHYPAHHRFWYHVRLAPLQLATRSLPLSPLSPMHYPLSAFNMIINCVLSDPHGPYNPDGVCGAGKPLWIPLSSGVKPGPRREEQDPGSKGF